MLLKEIKECLDAALLTKGGLSNIEIDMACGCDLMSDVLSFAKAGALLLTGLTSPQAIYTAEMAYIKAICFVRNKIPDSDTIKLAEEKGIILLSTHLLMFESCGRLYKKGLKGCSEVGEEKQAEKIVRR